MKSEAPINATRATKWEKSNSVSPLDQNYEVPFGTTKLVNDACTRWLIKRGLITDNFNFGSIRQKKQTA